MPYLMQLLPDEAQTETLKRALEFYAANGADTEDERDRADELRLEILKKKREAKNRGR